MVAPFGYIIFCKLPKTASVAQTCQVFSTEFREDTILV